MSAVNTHIESLPMQMRTLPAEPLVSVLIPNYNYAGYISVALDSLLDQSYPHFEAIVCDDGSEDNSCAIVEVYAERDPRIKLIKKANGGVASALNRAFSESNGQLIALLDADDVFLPAKLERLVAHWRTHPSHGMVMHAMHVIDASGKRLSEIPRGRLPETGWIADRVRARGGRLRNLPAGGLMLHRTLAETLFPIPEATFRSVADGYLYTLAALWSEVGYVPEVLAGYRLHGDNLTGMAQFTPASAQKYIEGVERILSAVNERLHDAGQAPLHLEKHLNWQEQHYLARTLTNNARPSALKPLLKNLWSDDLYHLPRKLTGTAAYAGAKWLPHGWRGGWVRMLLS